MYDSQTQSYMFRMREAVHISRQQLFLMREAVKHFTPTSVPDARSRSHFAPTLFRLHFQPQENSLSTFYILNLKGTHLSLDSQEDTSTPSSTSALPVIYHSSELLRLRYSLFVKNVVKVNDHHLGLCLYSYSDISKFSTPNYTIFQTRKFQ